MVSVAQQIAPAEKRERLFFFRVAVAIALTVAAGFGGFLAVGISSFAAPWWVHLHALTFVGWIAIYVTQNLLVLRDDISRHRALGRIAGGWAAWMVLVGLLLTPLTLAVGRSPPFFTPPYFLALDWVNIAVFAGLVYAGLRNRHRTDWHRRLMLCATICVIAPAFGRLIVLSGLPVSAALNVALLLVAMIADRVIRGRVHPAYFRGLGAIVAMVPAIELLVRIGPFVALAGKIAG